MKFNFSTPEKKITIALISVAVAIAIVLGSAIGVGVWGFNQGWFTSTIIDEIEGGDVLENPDDQDDESEDEESEDEDSNEDSDNEDSNDETEDEDDSNNEESEDESDDNNSSEDESSKDESSKEESSKEESSKDESSKDESSKEESSKEESSKEESSKEESSKEESSEDESSKEESSKEESSTPTSSDKGSSDKGSSNKKPGITILSSNTSTSIENSSSKPSSSESTSSTPEDDNNQGSGSVTTEGDFAPTSITLTFHGYDGYGVTWQTVRKPEGPVVRVSEGYSFNDNSYVEFTGVTETFTSYKSTGKYDIFVTKAEMTGLDANKNYTYKCYDKNRLATSQDFTFKTADHSANSFKFIHVSDTQSKNKEDEHSKSGRGTGDAYKATLNGIAANGFKANFFVHTGDFVEYSQYESYWNYMINTNAEAFATMPVLGVSGNHDTTYKSDPDGGSELYKHYNYDTSDQFAPAGTRKFGFSYAYDYGNTKFVMLNTNEGDGTGALKVAEYEWLENILKTNTKKWTIVAMHCPLYSPGQWGSMADYKNQSLALREQLSDLFAEYGVDMVLQGHDHVVSKTYPIGKNDEVQTNYASETIDGIKYYTGEGGVLYVINGTSADGTKSVRSERETKFYDPSYLVGNKANTWAEFEVTEEKITVNVFYYENSTVKKLTSYGIKK